MLNLVEYGLGKMLVGISDIGDTLTSFTFDNIEEEPKLIPEPIEIQEVEEIEVMPYVKKIDYLTYLDKHFSYKTKSTGVKYYILDKIKDFKYGYYDIEGTIHDRTDHKVFIKLDSNYQIDHIECSCKEHNCKHAYGIVLKYVDETIYKHKKIYYLFKTKYLLTQFRNLYNEIIEHVELTDDLEQRIICYDKLINNYSERDPNKYTYNEVKNHYDNLKNILYKLDKDLYNELIINVEFINYDICSKFYLDLVNEDYIEDIYLDNIDEM